ncbi:4-hydroxythreonine-4-phosphate dehydrogenase 2, (4- (phosphohydroxy)-L-threonine dehydrogenase 2) [Cupriavidus phytorum]|uniref:4-hydroxythreonine-4-phosphate dehydrogenase 2, (4- (Phosphohydroxy)-L-threonine dehydrogenase 2) n=2 Tax=Cupriavidus TaxID=106589 RepID=A0A375CKN9_9BURK|nr:MULTISPECIES: 4-hydroxythreonine-4-phosphate dehydrogenase PdxA [Cupriavidus]PZX22429.1 4-hydroxythreonine-4-phosphate dehydrogenase [Cupriavidus alkaliphilus]SOY74446.1 4-hydroxythreonine-4-phosphate dehydrogenase 2, (4- (phosphohydroxy)-L-threonine dehydrogenase 2) [Cupriavidus taiwanensis]
MHSRPRIAMVLGDPAGIGPELIARLLADAGTAAQAEILLIADRAEWRHGMQLAGVELALAETDVPAFAADGQPRLYHWQLPDSPAYARGVASAEGGRYSLGTLKLALDLAQAGQADAILFGPLNKSSLHAAGMAHSDELHWFAEQLGYHGDFCEFNVLDGLWTSRVTSHVALKDVPAMITPARVGGAIDLIDQALRRAGMASPRIAVCGLNPHNGDNGAFGREEIDVIAPAVAAACERGVDAQGPFPADTIFLKVQGGPSQRQFDAIVTMYHDQGQIGIKLMGFSRGVTVQGGLPVPITTPAHGTAFDITQQGRADPGATLQAFQIACRMGAQRRAATQA